MNKRLNEVLNELATDKFNLERKIEGMINNFATLNGIKIEDIGFEIHKTFNGKDNYKFNIKISI